MSSPIIGIDLGTTYSCCAIYHNNKVDIIPNDIGERTTPSVVSFTSTDRLIGKQAKNQITRNYENTIYNTKRLIGRSYNDPILKLDKKLFPFKIINDSKDKPLIIVTYKKEEHKFYPEQISSMILEKLKEDSEVFLGTKITKCVITVPAYFNNSQRQSTIDAGKIAGLEVLKIINEPTAAALAYGLEKNSNEKNNVCVFDLGGGTFDVTILEIVNKNFTVKATGGDTHLGGEDFDNELINYCDKLFFEKNGTHILDNQKALRRLKLTCEDVKKELSFQNDTFIDIQSLTDGKDFYCDITRNEFENLCLPYFEKCIEILDKVIKDSKLNKNEINEIVLVGGSTRIPKIQEMISEYFGKEKKMYKIINVDEAVAYGAAIQASLLNDEIEEGLDELILVDVCPLSLGTGVEGGLMSVIIPRNTPIPCEKTVGYVTVDDDQDYFRIGIYEGEREFYYDNSKLDSYYIGNLTKAPRGDLCVKVTLKLDENSILTVTAKEKGKDDILIDKVVERKKRNEEEIEQMIQEALKMKKDDLKKRKKVEVKNKLDEVLYQISKKDNIIYENNKDIIDEKVKEIKKWMINHKEEEVEVYENKIKEINIFISELKETMNNY
jgi:L1 cell adhesion molecule like protein